MPNERLRSALTERGFSARRVAEEVGVDPKTAERWVAGRVPHRGHRQTLAALLGEPESYLWPDADRGHELTSSQAELVTLYPHRADVPRELWRRVITSPVQGLDILVYAGAFLPEMFHDLTDVLAARASNGCQVRIALGDPSSDALRVRGEEERYGEGIQSRARVALRHYQPLIGTAGVTIGLHGTTLYNSIYRFDDDMLVNVHLWGANAFFAPVMHLRRVTGGTLFAMYAENFEAVWAQAQPVTQVEE